MINHTLHGIIWELFVIVFRSFSNRADMFGHALRVLGIVAIVLGDEAVPSKLTPNCGLVNDAIDQHIVNSNYDLRDQQADHMLIDWYGIQQDLDVYAYGYKLPWKVAFSVVNGTLHNLNTLSRVGDHVSCVVDTLTPISRTVEGKYSYAESLNLTYETFSAKFLFWEAQGSFTYKPHFVVHAAYLNGSWDCRLASFEVVSQSQSDYIVYTDDSWSGWLIRKIVQSSLMHYDPTPLFVNVLDFSKGYIDSSTREAWCNLWLPDVNQ